MSNRPHIASLEVSPSGGKPTGAGLKGQMFAQHYSGADLLVGPNGAGKTTRGPLGVTAALEGLATVPTDPRRPWVGSLPADTTIRATVRTAAGEQALSRDLSRSRGKAVGESDQMARDLVGIPPTAWDLRDFASGTDGYRGQLLDAVARAGGQLRQWTAAEADARVRALLEQQMPDGGDLALWLAAWVRCAALYSGAPDGATLLQSAIDWAGDYQKATNAEQRSTRAHAEEMSTSAPPTPDTDPAEDAAERSRLARALDESRDHAAEVTRAVAAQARHAAEGDRLRAAVAATVTEGKRLAVPHQPPALPDLGLLRIRVAECEYVPDDPADGQDADTLETAVVEAVAERQAATKTRETWHAEERRLATALADTLPALHAATVALERAELAAAAQPGEADAPTCVHCGKKDPLGTAPSADDARSAADAARAALLAAQLRRETALKARVLAEAALQAADDAERQAMKREAEAVARRDAAQAVIQSRNKDRARLLEQARAELARAEALTEQATSRHANMERQRGADLVAARGRWQEASAALKQWETTSPPEVPTALDPAKLDALRSELAVVDARIAARDAVESHRRQLAAALDRHEAARLAWDAARALVLVIRRTRDELADAAYRPIHDAARAIMAGTDGLPLPYFRSADDYGATVQGHGDVPYAGLSESEQRVTAAVLVAALASVAGNPCRLVLLDGLEVVQRDHRAPLLAALVAARDAGLVDQVIVTMATAEGEDLDYIQVPGLTVHAIEPWTREDPPEVDAPPPTAQDAPDAPPETETEFPF